MKTLSPYLLMIAVMSITLAATSFADSNVIIVETEDKTSADIPLEFRLQKTTWSENIGVINIWGTVSNPSSKSFRRVKVRFEAYNDVGEFLGAYTWRTEPDAIGPDEVGYIEDKHVETEGREPSMIRYKIMGE